MLKPNLFALFFLFPIFLIAQSPYEINWKKEPYILGLGTAACINGFILEKKAKPLKLEEILTLDRASLNRFDRNATFKYSLNARKASDVLFYSSFSLPIIFLTGKKTRNDFGQIMVLYGEAIFTTASLTYLTKRIVKRPRPYTYNELVPFSKKQKQQARFSFLSSHTSVTASNCFFIAKVFSDYYPDSKWKQYIWISATIIPALTGHLRVQAGKNFYTDVITGYSLGAAIGFLIPHLHKIQKDKALSLYPSSNGMALTWNFSK